MYTNIISENRGVVQIITINREDKLNALNVNLIQEIGQEVARLNAEKNVRGIIITGKGEKAFAAGADISEFAHFDLEQGASLSKEGQDLLFNLVENLTTPVIAAINGFALGGGLELALSAHFRVASENARMGLPETSLGLIPGYGGTQRLTQIVGKGRALELIMTGSMIDAKRALDYGLVNYVVPLNQLLITCTELAEKIMSNSPVAISAAIKAVNAHHFDGVNGFQVEISEFGKCFETEDFKEGTTAFLEKRKAKFTGK
jgi:enoyl-CoA hydratase